MTARGNFLWQWKNTLARQDKLAVGKGLEEEEGHPCWETSGPSVSGSLQGRISCRHLVQVGLRPPHTSECNIQSWCPDPRGLSPREDHLGDCVDDWGFGNQFHKKSREKELLSGLPKMQRAFARGKHFIPGDSNWMPGRSFIPGKPQLLCFHSFLTLHLEFLISNT